MEVPQSEREEFGALHLRPNGYDEEIIRIAEESHWREEARRLEKEVLKWRGDYYEVRHHLHTAHRGLERYARRQKVWRERIAALEARLGVRERLRRVR